ncbi:hypothetical protein K440DRAFT_568848, partial [Wilcoxina mikolae CBS 423.85]
LFIDVSGAFDNVSKDRLLQTLRQMDYPIPIQLHIWIFTDNQAAIQHFNTFKPGPGHSTSLALSNISNNLHALKTTITVQWVHGHTDVPGNELADKLAKQATLKKPPTYYHTSLSYLKRVT